MLLMRRFGVQSAQDLDYRKIKLIGEEVQGKTLLTNFYGMDMTRDKLCSLIRKWQSLIEANADVKTQDGYTLRLFAIAFTKKRPNQVRKTSYAQTAQVRAIRKKMIDIMTAEAAKSDLKGLVTKFIPEAISKEIEKQCNGIYPLQVSLGSTCISNLTWPHLNVCVLAECFHPQGEDDQGSAIRLDQAHGNSRRRRSGRFWRRGQAG
jgi:small subunit ribosomal protein S3Ae